jgi:N-acetyl sugar amidotransferase
MNEITFCKSCVLDSQNIDDFKLNENGICNYCIDLKEKLKKFEDKESNERYLDSLICEIKKSGKRKSFDCILGVSGGVDSTFLAYWAYQNGLKPLVVHFDNGWNSEIAVKNIYNLCNKLNFELHTYVINWEEFKSLQLAYLRSGVIDIEVITDHAIFTTLLDLAYKYKLNYSLNGFNLTTEGIMPRNWIFDKYDFMNIKDINDKFGNRKIKHYPHLTIYKKLFYKVVKKIESVQVLNFLQYNKLEAKRIIKENLNWVDYGGKHYESIFTKFYQSYILPEKFKVDKRYAHLSNLICSGSITKEEAKAELKKTLYEKDDLDREIDYFLKKFNITKEEFDSIISQPPKSHLDYPNGVWINNLFKFFTKGS